MGKIVISIFVAANTDTNLENHYRYYNRDIIKDILVAIQGSCNSGDFKIYQPRTNNNYEWKRHYAGGRKVMATSFGDVGFEFKIATSLQNRESSLSIWVFASYKTDRLKFVESMQKWYDAQSYGFVYLDEHCGFLLDNKTVHADARDEIIQYFTYMVPVIIAELEKALQA